MPSTFSTSSGRGNLGRTTWPPSLRSLSMSVRSTTPGSTWSSWSSWPGRSRGSRSLSSARTRCRKALALILFSAGASVRLLGPRPYADVPGYLQHADVIVVPHRVDAFTESLDPIKAYECLAVARPVVATPVAGLSRARGLSRRRRPGRVRSRREGSACGWNPAGPSGRGSELGRARNLVCSGFRPAG